MNSIWASYLNIIAIVVGVVVDVIIVSAQRECLPCFMSRWQAQQSVRSFLLIDSKIAVFLAAFFCFFFILLFRFCEFFVYLAFTLFFGTFQRYVCFLSALSIFVHWLRAAHRPRLHTHVSFQIVRRRPNPFDFILFSAVHAVCRWHRSAIILSKQASRKHLELIQFQFAILQKRSISPEQQHQR